MIDIFIYFPISNHHIKFKVVMVCIREVMAIQVRSTNSMGQLCRLGWEG